MKSPAKTIKFQADTPETYIMLAYASMRMKATQPDLWVEFIKAFDAVLNHHGQNIGMMPPDPTMSIYTQGRLKALMMLASVFDGCSVIVKNYEQTQEIIDGTRAATAARART